MASRTTVRQQASQCCGCSACVTICPVDAIIMKADAEGFAVPHVDSARCIGCNRCELFCTQKESRTSVQPLSVFGGAAVDADVRTRASSGGIFSLLAHKKHSEGAVVFGAVFTDSFEVEHAGAVTREGIEAMFGSKYVESQVASAVVHARQVLQNGMPVLFAGTPCQVEGLRKSLSPEENELLTAVDFVCHGVPSPAVFKSYLNWLTRDGRTLTSFGFRSKIHGWKDFSVKADFNDGSSWVASQTEDPYMRGFLQNLYLRPSCHHCRIRHGCHAADLTLADLWGAQDLYPDRDDDTGLSLILCNTEKGREMLRSIEEQLNLFEVKDLAPMQRFNPSIFVPAVAHRNRNRFFQQFAREGFRPELIDRMLRAPGLWERGVGKVRRTLGRLMPSSEKGAP